MRLWTALFLAFAALPAAAATATTVTASANPAIAGQPVTLRATVSPPPSRGTVTFRSGGTVLGVVPAGKQLTVSLPAGTHLITADFSGDVAHAASTSEPLELRVVATRDAALLDPTTVTIAGIAILVGALWMMTRR